MSEAKEPLFKRWQVQDHERANAIAGQIELMLCSAMGATRDCAWDEILAALTAKADLEQRVADIETRTSVKLGEFARLTDIIDAECKRLGIEWHGSASTTLKAVIEAAGVKPGDVVLRPTGEMRKVRDGEWFRNGDDRYIRHDGYLTVSKFPIYRRLRSPNPEVSDGKRSE